MVFVTSCTFQSDPDYLSYVFILHDQYCLIFCSRLAVDISSMLVGSVVGGTREYTLRGHAHIPIVVPLGYEIPNRTSMYIAAPAHPAPRHRLHGRKRLGIVGNEIPDSTSMYIKKPREVRGFIG